MCYVILYYIILYARAVLLKTRGENMTNNTCSRRDIKYDIMYFEGKTTMASCRRKFSPENEKIENCGDVTKKSRGRQLCTF